MRGLGLPGCALRRDGADLDKAEAHGAQAVDAAGVLVQPGGQADAVGEAAGRPASTGSSTRLLAVGPVPAACPACAPARRMVSSWARFGVEAEQKGAGEGVGRAGTSDSIIPAISQTTHRICRSMLPKTNSKPWSARPRCSTWCPARSSASAPAPPSTSSSTRWPRMKDQIKGAVSSSVASHRAAAGAGHPGVRRQRGGRAVGLHRRRRRDRWPRLHDQGRRRGAHAREDRGGAVAALCLHRRRVQAGDRCWARFRCRWR